MTLKSRNKFIAFLLIFYYWIKSILVFFVPKRLRYKSVIGELVLITGSGSGLGRALAIKFASRGANLILWDINKAGLDETVKLVNKFGVAVKSYVCDVTDRMAVYETAAKVREEAGIVTILVNNAGVVNGKKLLSLDDDKIMQTLNVNFISHFWTLKAFLPDMIENNHGHLVTISSIAGQTGSIRLADYCASKYGAVGLEESLRLELLSERKIGVKSTIILPYFINTGMFAGFKSPILPSLEPEVVAQEVMTAILIEQEVVCIPKIFYPLNTLKTVLPTKAFYKLFEALGGYDVMEDFTGRHGVISNNNDINGLNNSVNNNDVKRKKIK